MAARDSTVGLNQGQSNYFKIPSHDPPSFRRQKPSNKNRATPKSNTSSLELSCSPEVTLAYIAQHTKHPTPKSRTPLHEEHHIAAPLPAPFLGPSPCEKYRHARRSHSVRQRPGSNINTRPSRALDGRRAHTRCDRPRPTDSAVAAAGSGPNKRRGRWQKRRSETYLSSRRVLMLPAAAGRRRSRADSGSGVGWADGSLLSSPLSLLYPVCSATPSQHDHTALQRDTDSARHTLHSAPL